MSRAVKRIQDADPSTDRLITRVKITGCGKREPDDVILELFVGHDSEIEPVVKKTEGFTNRLHNARNEIIG